MNIFFPKNTHPRKKFCRYALLFLLLFCLPFLLSACKQKLNYFDYVSELRSNVFIAQTEEFSLRIYAVNKEAPYVPDGIPQAVSPRVEVYLVAPEGNKTTNITFQIDEKSYGGEMSYDNVKCEYYYSQTLDVSARNAIDCLVKYGDKEVQLRAASVVTKNTLPPETVLDQLLQARPEPFTALTDEYGFAGEIYLRLIYEDAAYYYVGVIDRTGKINAFLINAETGKILAHREG